jgi:hypothetical protein
MTSELVEVEGQTVTAAALKNTEATLLRQRQAAPSVSDAISAEEIASSGASDVADAMTRVTGASVVEGKYVFIRGLGDRYGNSNMNGSPLPSPNPDKQSVPMDLIPAGLLDNVVVQKTFTPDKPGNFSGGSVDLATRDFPGYRTFTFSSSVGYNTATTGESILWTPGGSKDWLGYDDGKRAIPDYVMENPELAEAVPDNFYTISGFPDSSYLNTGVKTADLVNYMDSSARAFNPDMTPERRDAPLDQSYSFSYGDDYRLFGKPLGVLASLTYSHKYRYYGDGVYREFAGGGQNSRRLSQDFDLKEEQGTDDVLWGGMLNLKYKLHPSHKIGFNYIRNQNGESKSRSLWGKAYKIDNDTARFTYFANVISYAERQLNSTQFSGEHYGMLGSDLRAE